MGALFMLAASLLAAAALLALSTAWVIYAAKVYRENKLNLFVQSGLGLVLAAVLATVGAGFLSVGH